MLTDAIRKVHDFLTVGAPAPFQEGVAVALAVCDFPSISSWRRVSRPARPASWRAGRIRLCLRCHPKAPTTFSPTSRLASPRVRSAAHRH